MQRTVSRRHPSRIPISNSLAILMSSLPALILDHASNSPEGALLCLNTLLHLGTPAGIDQGIVPVGSARAIVANMPGYARYAHRDPLRYSSATGGKGDCVAVLIVGRYDSS